MLDFLFYIVAGAGVGLAVGITGVGGGSLMTPLLIFAGVPEKIAIGTDLLYAAITKTGAAWSHTRQGSVKWRLVFFLAAGSLPASLITSVLLHRLGDHDYSPLLTKALGLMLVITALMLFFRRWLQRHNTVACESAPATGWHHRHADAITFAAGILLGILVTLSSVGAGAFCAVLLLTLYPRLPILRVIGTDIAHAVPLTLIAGLGHLVLLGNVDFVLLGGLLIGSLPAVYFGAKFAARLSTGLLQPLLGILLLIIGVKFLLS